MWLITNNQFICHH